MKKTPYGLINRLINRPGIKIDDNLFSLDSKSVDQDSIHNQKPDKLLGHFSEEDTFNILEKLHIINKLIKSGFNEIIFDIDIKSFMDQRICIFDREKNRANLLIEIRLTNNNGYRDITHIINHKEYKFLLVEWLVMQNPRLGLQEKKRRLPGQDYPGLTLGYALIDFLQIIANILELDGIMCYPEYFHNAYFYSKYFYFVNADKQAELLAILRDFSLIDIAMISNMIETNKVRLNFSSEPYEWTSKEQIMPIEDSLSKYFESDEYIRLVQGRMKNYRFISIQSH